MVYKIFDALSYIVLNYIVANIPVWSIRKTMYKLFGMRIGKGSRIYMKCIIRHPWKITIGENTIINENCVLDGRGELEIHNNVSISLFSTIISASHDSKSGSFKYVKGKVVIEDNVWIGTRSVILQDTRLRDSCILAAASSLKGDTEKGYIYAGVPARKVKERQLKNKYNLKFYDFWR